MPESQYLTLSQFQRLVGNTLRTNPALQQAWVVAELSDVRVNGGHCYMELIEKDDRGGMRAKMRAMIWRSVFEPLNRRFREATGSAIGNGMKVLVCGSVNHHEVYGLSFVISAIDPRFTLGDMERLRREILDRLRREGVSELNRRLPVPVLPQRIAVISSAGAAGYGDFINQIESNSRGYAVYPMLFPAILQGDRTVPTVLVALDWVEHTRQFWDCVVIIRGGGATTDLNSFDNYDLARRVCTFPLPVVVGIGHERDRTVLDELACVRCKTPTAVAAWILEQLDNAWARTCDSCTRIARYAADAVKGEHLRLARAESSLPPLVATRTMRARMELERIGNRMATALQGKSSQQRNMLQLKVGRLESAARAIIANAGARIEKLESLQRVLSPENTLRRGYSITRINGHAVTHAGDVAPGDIVETTLMDGTLISKVEKNGKQ